MRITNIRAEVVHASVYSNYVFVIAETDEGDAYLTGQRPKLRVADYKDIGAELGLALLVGPLGVVQEHVLELGVVEALQVEGLGVAPHDRRIAPRRPAVATTSPRCRCRVAGIPATWQPGCSP